MKVIIGEYVRNAMIWGDFEAMMSRGVENVKILFQMNK